MTRNAENAHIVQIGLSEFRGVDLKTDPEDMAEGKFTGGKNMVCNAKTGTVQVRNGYQRQIADPFADYFFILPTGGNIDYPESRTAYKADPNNVLHLHADSDFTDSSTAAHVVTGHGSTSIDTTPGNSKFGAGCVLFAGSGSSLSVADSDDFDPGAGDFTIDFWVKFVSQVGVNFLFANCSDFDYTIYYSGGALGATAWTNQGHFTLTGDAITLDVWQHCAFVRYGNIWTLYQDGEDTAASTLAGTMLAAAGDSYIGNEPGGSYNFLGRIDEFRFSKGIARWTEPFTPPTEAYTGLIPYTAFGGVRKSRVFGLPVTANATSGIPTYDTLVDISG
jgi:hypothetical protein